MTQDLASRIRKRREEDDEALLLLAAVREIIRRAIMTLNALRDPERRYLGFASMPQNIVHDVREAYGYSSASLRDFAPTAQEVTQMENVLPWLAWLKRQHGDSEARRFIGWAMGVSIWRLAKREGCSDRTIHNRLDRSVSLMIAHFVGPEIRVEVIEEPYKSTPYAMVFEKSPGPHGEAIVSKVYIGGEGMFRGGKRLRTSLETVDAKYCA